MNYQEFLKSKERLHTPSGLDVSASSLNEQLYPFQRAIVSWALKLGKAAIFADCGLGKTPMQLEWAHQIPGRKLIIAPLAVSEQTKREGMKFGRSVCDLGMNDSDVEITNYEQIHKIDPTRYNGIVLDESSILKNHTGKYRTQLIELFQLTPYKLCCTATPAPNDFTELGNHAEFLNICSREEMLAEYFVHDGGETQKWRLKGHARSAFWQWICSWAVNLRKPSDIGFCDDGYDLPALHINDVIVRADYQEIGFLFPMQANSLSERQQARKKTVKQRAQSVADLVNQKPHESWIVWCNLNSEAEAVTKLINDAVEIRGSHKPEVKTQRMLDFTDGKIRVLVSKPSICGLGMNWQHCSNVVFCGLSDSYEQFYQAVRRCWRFGQDQEVNAYIVISDTEGAVSANIKRKEKDAETLATEMLSQFSQTQILEG